jgi:hypothetical protein
LQSHLLLSKPGPRLAGIRRQLARRADAVTASPPAGSAPTPTGVGEPQADQLNLGRAPEESYRDYVFRKGI